MRIGLVWLVYDTRTFVKISFCYCYSVVDSQCPAATVTNEEKFGEYVKEIYNSNAERVSYIASEASWTYNTNITDHNSAAMVSIPLILN